jgi:Ser/Thr protein kinase RdoA (MazF antagonist)
MDQFIRDRYSPAILDEAMRRYDIAPGDIEKGDGFESYIYRFKRNDERFILRITHTYRRTPELIRGEVDWINYLAAGGAGVARAVVSARGELVEEIEDGSGGRFLATAFTFAPGQTAWKFGWSPALMETYGRLIGRMHALTKDYEPADHGWRRPVWPDNSIEEVERALATTDPATLEVYNALVEHVNRLPRRRDSYGLIHFDAHEGNFFVDDNGRITLFDFDDCVHNWFVNDIAMVVFYKVANHDNPSAVAADFVPHFMRGYTAEYALDSAWAAYIPDFMKMREIELYAIIIRSYGSEAIRADNISHDWTRHFMTGRQARLAANVPYLDYQITW